MAVGVVDELPVQLLGLLRVELLTALRALELAVRLDADVDDGAVAGPCRGADLHVFRHGCV